MDELAGVGAVVRVGARRFVVMGHRIVADGEFMGPGYVVVPYPLGFVGPESISLVPASVVAEVARAGFADAASEAYLAEFAQLAKGASGLPASEYEASERLLADFAQKEADRG